MLNTIGQIIKRLRKEQNFTQEELAELLNVTPQAVSKWENETGLPDISQIIPLASVFGVTTDVLFGISDTSIENDILQIISEVNRTNSNKIEDKKAAYDILQDGLKRYPNNNKLLMHSLEYGISLAYPENDCYDEIHGKEIYHECIRQADIAISLSKNVTDVLRTHMIMVILHSAYDNAYKAWEHARKFPWRADMTVHVMSAYISHAEKDYLNESLYCQRDFMYHLEAILDDVAQLGVSYHNLGKYNDALKMFFSVFKLIELTFAEEPLLPAFHCRERGDVHSLIALTYLELCDNEKALYWLEKMVNYDIEIRSQFKDDMTVQTPFLRDIKFTWYWTFEGSKKRLLAKLNNVQFDCLRNNKRFLTLLERANKMCD